MRAFLIFVTLLFNFQAAAHQPKSGNIYGSLGPYFLRTVPQKHDFESPFFTGVGLVINGDVDDNGGLEISLVGQEKIVSLKQDSRIITQRSDRIVITSGYRHWFSKSFGMGLGFFSSYLMGSPTTIRSDFLTDAPKTSACDTTEYGLEFSGQLEPYRWPMVAPIIDFRYAISLTDKPNEDSAQFAIFVALKFVLQQK